MSNTLAKHVCAIFFIFITFKCYPSRLSQTPKVMIEHNISSVTLYYGETIQRPITMRYNLPDPWLNHGVFVLPPIFSLKTSNLKCQHILNGNFFFGKESCAFILSIAGSYFTHGMTFQPYFELRSHPFFERFSLGPITVQVIPHPLSLNTIPEQYATAGVDFHASLVKYLNYYDENIRFGNKPVFIVTPLAQSGLYFDVNTQSIRGNPEKTGSYYFSVRLANALNTSLTFSVHAKENLKNKPIFKTNYKIPSAMPGRYYQWNLFDLLETQPGVGSTNQISFRIDFRRPHPEWLQINSKSLEVLEGRVPEWIAGQRIDITLIAHSNTGGDSEPLQLSIPVAFDASQKPQILPFTLEKAAGTRFEEDILSYIKKAEGDDSIKLLVKNTEPKIDWLSVSDVSATTLVGIIPENASGQTFLLELIANSDVGGSSEPVTIPFKILINAEKTPYFPAGKPQLHFLNAGQSYCYDFRKETTVFPDYEEAPWQIHFAENDSVPYWLTLENNRLTSENVPDDIPSVLSFWVLLQNIPGGASKPLRLQLRRG